jgi:hypothetical protein
MMDEATYRQLINDIKDEVDIEKVLNDLHCYEDNGLWPWEM